jgi:tetratricopeptide (TPR) repeat protein
MSVLGLFVGLALWVCTGHAGAQDAEPPPQDASAQETPAGEAHVEEARARVARGEALFERGDYDAALTEFEAAYERIGEHPNRYLILYNIGQCQERRFRYDLALEYYRRYLAEGGSSAEDSSAVTESIAELESLLATVRIGVNAPNATVLVDEREVGTAPGVVRIPAGLHVVEVRAPGYVPARAEVQIAAGAEEQISLTLEQLSEEYEGLSPVFFFAIGGVSVAALATGVILGLVAVSDRNDVEARLDDPILRWQVEQGEIDSISTMSLTADIFFGTAALFAVGAVVVALLTDWSGDEEDDQEGVAARGWAVRF